MSGIPGDVHIRTELAGLRQHRSRRLWAAVKVGDPRLATPPRRGPQRLRLASLLGQGLPEAHDVYFLKGTGYRFLVLGW